MVISTSHGVLILLDKIKVLIVKSIYIEKRTYYLIASRSNSMSLYYPREELYENAGVNFKVVRSPNQDLAYQPEKGLLFWLILDSTTKQYTHITIEVGDDVGSHYFSNIKLGDQTAGNAFYLQLPTPGAELLEVQTKTFKFTSKTNVTIFYELYNVNQMMKKNYRSSMSCRGEFNFTFISNNPFNPTSNSTSKKRTYQFNDPEINEWQEKNQSSSNFILPDDADVSTTGINILSQICNEQHNLENDDDDEYQVSPPPLQRIQSHPTPKKPRKNDPPQPLQQPIEPSQQPIEPTQQLIEPTQQPIDPPQQPIDPPQQAVDPPQQEISLDEMWKEIEEKIKNKESEEILSQMWKQIEEKIKQN